MKIFVFSIRVTRQKLSFLRKNLMPYEYFTSYLFDKIKEKFNQDYKLQDVYMNGQEPLRNGSFHVDGDADRIIGLIDSKFLCGKKGGGEIVG